jgi:hypothetical protein
MKIKASGRSALMVAAGIWLWCAGPIQAQEATGATPPAAPTQQATQPNPLQQLFGVKPAPATAPTADPSAASAEPGQPVALNKYRKASSRHSRRHRASRSHRHSRHSRRAAAESKAPSETKAKTKAAEAETESTADAHVADADNTAVPEKVTPAPAKDAATPLTASVANANAQLLDNNPTPGNAAALNSAPATIADRSSPSAALDDGSQAPQPGNKTTADAGRNEAGPEAGVVPPDQLNDVDRAMATQAQPAPTLALASVNTPEPVTTGQAASSDDNSSWAQASLIGKIFIAFGGLLTLASAVRMLIA